MASITVHNSPPSLLTAGDVYHWKEVPANIADVSSFVITFRSITNSANDFSVTGSDQTTYFLFQLAGTVTEDFDSSEFTISNLITYSWGRETEQNGKLELLDNPSNDPAKSFNQRMVDLLEAHVEGRLPEGLESHTVGGVPIVKITITDANNLLSDYKNRLALEQKSKLRKANPGRASGNSIHLRF